MRLLLVADVQQPCPTLLGHLRRLQHTCRMPAPASIVTSGGTTFDIVLYDSMKREPRNHANRQSVHEVMMCPSKPASAGKSAAARYQNRVRHRRGEATPILNGVAKRRPWARVRATEAERARAQKAIVSRGAWLEVTVDGERKILGPGDAYMFQSSRPHRFKALRNERCVVVSACTPPTF